MQYFKRIIGVILGTMLLSIGVSFCTLSLLGVDTITALITSFIYLFKLESLSYGYTVCYIGVNIIFVVIMFCVIKDKFGIATIINLIFTGIIIDLFNSLFIKLNMNTDILWIRVIYSICGLIIISFGVALYGGANLGISPYDSMPLVISKFWSKVSYKFSRMMCDFTCILISLIIGVIIMKQYTIIHVNTLLTLLLVGPLISFFSKLINKHYYKFKVETFK